MATNDVSSKMEALSVDDVIQGLSGITGSSVTKVSPEDFPVTGRGMKCLQAVKKDDLLLAVPFDCCWSEASALACPELAPVLEVLEPTPDQLLTLHLLVEKARGAESGMHSHLQTLPATYDTTAYWTEEELGELTGSRWFDICKMLAAEREQEFSELKAKLEEAGQGAFLSANKIDLAAYTWAEAVFRSRKMHITLEDGDQASLLVPFADLFNHAATVVPGSSVFVGEVNGNKELRMLCIRAAQDYAAGEQAFISYGRASNGKLMASAGFVLEGNPHNHVDLQVSVPVNEELLPMLMLAAPEAPAPGDLEVFQFLKVPSDDDLADGAYSELVTAHALTLEQPVPPALLAYLRVRALSSTEFNEETLKATAAGQPLYLKLQQAEVLSATNELQVLSGLYSRLTSMLAKYPTSKEEDRRLLQATPPLPLRKRLAVQVRLEEKEILEGSRAWVLERLGQAMVGVLAPLLALEGKNPDAGPGSVWVKHLSARKEEMEALQPAIVSRFHGMHGAAMGPATDTLGVWVQTANLFFMWLTDLVETPCSHRACLVPRHWPLTGPSTSAAIDWSGAEGGEGEEAGLVPYLRVYAEKMKMWGAFLMSEWMECRAFRLETMNTMLMESVNLRHQHSWSVPTVAALKLIQGLGMPVVEVGDAGSHWATQLGKMGVAATHAEAAAADAGSALLLVWPDPQGQGAVGLESVKAFTGPKLVLVGEWSDRTFGAYNESLSQSGQSFSKECQEYVEANFTLVETCPLPNWPLYLDALMLYDRK